MIKTDEDAWTNCNLQDKWVFNKLEIALRAGVDCGLREIPVRNPGLYVVRPTYNLNGLSLGAKVVNLTPETTEDKVPVGHFWSTKLKGQHISVDYKKSIPVLTVRGRRKNFRNLAKFDSWEKLSNDKAPRLPKFLHSIARTYKTINVEYINNTPIEVHLRGNPDFSNHKYTKLITVFSNDPDCSKRSNFIKDEEVIIDQQGQKLIRLGFLGY